jgi:large subunit ribosomal protein L16
MLLPKKTKYKKYHKGKIKGQSKKGYLISFGVFALIATSRGRLSSKQIESARIAINRHVKKTGQLWIRIFPDIPITKKPAEIRMGKGKGAVNEWISVIKPGRILYEINGVNENIAKKAMKLAQAKLSISTKIIFKCNEYTY